VGKLLAGAILVLLALLIGVPVLHALAGGVWATIVLALVVLGLLVKQTQRPEAETRELTGEK
jgi:hypothetical protein